MIKKEKLSKQINKAIELEEKLIPLFGRHIPASVSFSGLGPKDQKQVVDYLQQRVVNQTRHVEILKAILDGITGKATDVY